jgi:prepilin-type N-terminal cleavage/methylation domain-containing protein
MRGESSEAGFTLVELLVAMLIFGFISTSIYLVVYSGVRSSETARTVADISEEARLGLNRMIRDTREAERLTAAAADSYTIHVDFNRDGDTTDADEQETFAFDAGNELITLNGEVLVRDIHQIGTDATFSYLSNSLEYDTDQDGEATRAEVIAAKGAGQELPFLTNVSFALEVGEGDQATHFRSEAQLRNRR